MSLEIHTFPQDMIELVSDMPIGKPQFNNYASLARRIQSLATPMPDFIRDKPVVVSLDGGQYETFEQSLSEKTPLSTTTPGDSPVNKFSVLQMVLGSSIGNLLSIPEVRGGALVQDIIPREKSRYVESSSYGSEADFVFHNDLSFLDEQDIPDFVNLGCIRNIEGAKTIVASVEDILGELDHADIAELRQPQFELSHTYFRGLATERVGRKLSAVFLDHDEISLGVEMIPQSPEAGAALRNLRELLAEVSTPHQLQPGEVLILPNRRSVHARNSFIMSEEASSRRWLQRLNIGSTRD